MAKAPASKVAFTALCELLGKEPTDPAVKALLAKAGKVTIKPDFIIAKEAGFDFALDRPEGAKKKQLTCLFLYPEGRDKHRGFAGLPTGFAWTTRADLLANLPAPTETWKMGKGSVPVTTKNPDHDRWTIDGYTVKAEYRDGAVNGIYVEPPEDAAAGRDISTSPLHFSTMPADAPKDAKLTAMALLVAWAADRFGVPAKHAGSAPGQQLAKRAITPRAFYKTAIKKGLHSTDVDPKLASFLWGYTHRMFLDDNDDKARAKADAKIHALLRLEGKNRDERAYDDDYLGTFSDLASPFYVPDSWDAVDRIAPVLDARWADYEATAFETAPDMKLYAKAAKLRDAVNVTPDSDAKPAQTADDSLASDLVACIDQPLANKAVQAVLARAGLPVGKKIDRQANPALCVSYMGVKEKIGGTPKMVLDSVDFWAAKQTISVRSLRTEVEFLGYPGKLPWQLALGMSRAAATKALGKPSDVYEDDDHFLVAANRRVICTFQNGKLVRCYVGHPLKK